MGRQEETQKDAKDGAGAGVGGEDEGHGWVVVGDGHGCHGGSWMGCMECVCLDDEETILICVRAGAAVRYRYEGLKRDDFMTFAPGIAT